MHFIYHRIRYAFAQQAPLPGAEYLIIGLGNPGRVYADTRHNIGQKFVLHLAKEWKVPMQEGPWGSQGKYNNLILFTPMAFMNLSGLPVAKIAKKNNIPVQNIIVAHDDLENHPGINKMKLGGSPQGHNGLKSIIQELRADTFMRLKLGVGRPQTRDPDAVSDYVLSKLDYQLAQKQFQSATALLIKQLKL